MHGMMVLFFCKSDQSFGGGADFAAIKRMKIPVSKSTRFPIIEAASSIQVLLEYHYF